MQGSGVGWRGEVRDMQERRGKEADRETETEIVGNVYIGS